MVAPTLKTQGTISVIELTRLFEVEGTGLRPHAARIVPQFDVERRLAIAGLIGLSIVRYVLVELAIVRDVLLPLLTTVPDLLPRTPKVDRTELLDKSAHSIQLVWFEHWHSDILILKSKGHVLRSEDSVVNTLFAVGCGFLSVPQTHAVLEFGHLLDFDTLLQPVPHFPDIQTLRRQRHVLGQLDRLHHRSNLLQTLLEFEFRQPHVPLKRRWTHGSVEIGGQESRRRGVRLEALPRLTRLSYQDGVHLK